MSCWLLVVMLKVKYCSLREVEVDKINERTAKKKQEKAGAKEDACVDGRSLHLIRIVMRTQSPGMEIPRRRRRKRQQTQRLGSPHHSLFSQLGNGRLRHVPQMVTRSLRSLWSRLFLPSLCSPHRKAQEACDPRFHVLSSQGHARSSWHAERRC